MRFQLVSNCANASSHAQIALETAHITMGAALAVRGGGGA